MSHPFVPHGVRRDPSREAPTARLEQTTDGILALCRDDVARCLRDARRRRVDPRDFVFVVGAPRLVARYAPEVEVCECPALAVGVDRAAVVATWRKLGRATLADDLAAPLAAGQIRVWIVRDDGHTVTTVVPAAATSAAPFHACSARGGR